MEQNIFSPKVQSLNADALSAFFLRSAQWILGLTIGLMPLWFIPYTNVSLGFTKATMVVVGVYGVLILSCLALLRSGKVSLYRPITLVAFWLFSIALVISAVLSGDTFDALFGASLDIHSAFFTVLMAVVMTSGLVFVKSRGAVVRTFLMLGIAFSLVYVYSLVRFFVGPDIFSFGVLTSNFVTIIGGLNDLALYAGLCLSMLLVGLFALPNNQTARIVATLFVLSSLAILAVVNFSFVWIVVGFLSLLTFLYLVAKDTWLRTGSDSVPASRFSLALVAFICIVSGAFIVSGDYLGAKVSALTGINYLEVRPSVSATIDVAKSVYSENAFTGIGPNRFEDAWRLYKDPVINETQFWATSFVSGNSYVLTVLATTGVLGSVFFGLFIMLFLYTGYRLVVRPNDAWSTIGLISFAAATYLWLMCFWYTPGVTVLLLAAFFTGIMVAVSESQRATPIEVLNVAYSRQHGFILIATSLITIVTATAALIALMGIYRTESVLADGVRSYAETADEVDFDIALQSAARALPQQDIYTAERARLRLAELNQLSSLSAPTEEDRQRYEALLVEGVQLTEAAIAIDRTNPFNYSLLAQFYGLLDPSQFDGIRERQDDALMLAKQYDPKNPEYGLIAAQIALRTGDVERARGELETALALKNNYTDALFLFSQVEVQAGNATSAIAVTRSIIAIEPYNPGRRYQLGLLLVAIGELDEAKQAFTDAVTLDPNYANARYMLALTHLDLGERDAALLQLKAVQATNPDNESLRLLISEVEQGQFSAGTENPTVLPEASTVTENTDQSVTSNPPDTDLVTPVNRVPAEVEAGDLEAVPVDSVNSTAE